MEKDGFIRGLLVNGSRTNGGRSIGPRTQAGKERARRVVIKHREYTKEARAKHKEVMALIKNRQRYTE